MEENKKSSLWSVIGASSVGTMIEWYDFYIFGSLATIISTKFFPTDNPTAGFLSTLATFAAGFVVRPFGALFFGRLGDLIGRKYTFMVTLVLMGGATFLIGCIPSYATIGFMAPTLVLILRLLQGLALGGEYGGAATYVAEHAGTGQRGYWTSWIQTTATIGLFISLLVIMSTKASMSKEAFEDWGWRVPFWVSILMIFVSYLIRKNMGESPEFAKVKAEGKVSTNPLKESFGNKLNFKFVLLALFGIVMGQGVVWYTGQFYAMSFIEKVMGVSDQVGDIMMYAILMATPFFVVFGWLSDKIGRKWLMLTGMLIAVVIYRPVYRAMYETSNIKNKTEIVEKTVKLAELKENKDKAMDSVYTTTKEFTDGATYKEVKTVTLENGKAKLGDDGKVKAVTKKTVKINDSDKWTLVWLVFIQIFLVTMVYGPTAAFLVEMFPAKIRYTSMSLPYHIGNGIFGGLLPAVATSLVAAATKANEAATAAGEALPVAEPYLQGLWYPIIIGAVCFVIGVIYVDGKSSAHKN
ncbi:MFS transporter [Flavobacterium branchiophilum]|uniref:MFS transporter n=1 Tax=Flavobacterium branchiophilum TaxID=55197 RepID=A0A2H3KVG4_9FLAO|nr:MFS transporter [Flavobacterium branchiophilum]OXA81907.1 MFS transporter [Flavobacterium branchiophilum] [Flavobacterium branchiophilum NBRC 15030 = ATCC 35035]PDS22706.1 MFS transporter [Flavobacterium branchiophilum]TQM42314.1 putative MFS family arabinose efflux permease [Flavobacterium branchiophilum]